MNGDFICLRFENGSFYTGDIADIHFFEVLIRLLSDKITGNIALNGSLKVLYMTE